MKTARFLNWLFLILALLVFLVERIFGADFGYTALILLAISSVYNAAELIIQEAVMPNKIELIMHRAVLNEDGYTIAEKTHDNDDVSLDRWNKL